jgi:hypothetical protein
MRVLVHGCFYPRVVQRSILRLLRRLPDGDTLDVPKHVEDLLKSDVYIFVHVILVIQCVPLATEPGTNEDRCSVSQQLGAL